MELFKCHYNHIEVSKKIKWAEYVLLICTPLIDSVLDSAPKLTEEEEQFIRVFKWMDCNLYACEHWLQHYGMIASNERHLKWLFCFYARRINDNWPQTPGERLIRNQIYQYFKIEEACLS